MASVRDAGHELGLHGYTHEYPSQLTAQQQHDVLSKSIEILTKFCDGVKPRGYTAPAWSTSKELIPQLEESGIIYDHSFMHHDFQMYFAPDNSHTWVSTNISAAASTWMQPMSILKPSRVVEIPANWHIDDWPPLQPIPGRAGAQGFVDTSVVEKLWREQWDFAYREYETFVFPISIHPQVSGKGQVIMMLER
jgi:peptidoglycan/xylan/chitin deacetylase (PgdA/CDA1 family)